MRFRVFTALAPFVILGGSGEAVAQDSKAQWLKRPRAEDLLSVWPAESMHLGGVGTIRCKVSLQGGLFDCVVVEETPKGAGFGRAALTLTPQLLMKPAMKDGKPVVSEVVIPIHFEEPKAPTGSHIRGAAARHPTLTRKVVSDVPWTVAPTYPDAVAAYPAKARERGVGGAVTLDCTFNGSGGLSSCQTLREEPRGMGFGAAAKTLTKRFVGPTARPDGESIRGVGIQIRFTFAPDMLDGGAPLIGKPDWVALPDVSDFGRAFPAEARKAGVSKARVALRCTVAAGGRMDGCQVQSEEPAGLGFGQAALSLSPAFQVSIWTPEGLPTVGGSVRIPIRYDLEATVRAPENK